VRLWFGHTDWHPEPQWMLDAIDVDRNVERSFALRDVETFLDTDRRVPDGPSTPGATF
jgi:hypothetical protein